MPRVSKPAATHIQLVKSMWEYRPTVARSSIYFFLKSQISDFGVCVCVGGEFLSFKY